ncbi:MAG: B12-binding domain-containing radical SAM protein [Elusimicrobiales bacterium]|nr:B12-binding domain-containing radical SAM protein [Elusimicrobiales bacterium]
MERQAGWDVIFINPAIVTPYQQKYPPFAFLFLAFRLKRLGYRVRIVDLQLEKETVLDELLAAGPPLWIGFTVMTGTAITRALEVSARIRRAAPGVPLVWGGPQPAILPEVTLGHPLVDIVVTGEGEAAAAELTAALKEGRPLSGVKGIGYKLDGQQHFTPPAELEKNWDAEIGYAWEEIPLREYVHEVNGVRVLPMITSRGCPFRCAFCWNLKANRRSWRGWSAPRVIRELRDLSAAYGIQQFSFHDDFCETLFTNPELLTFFRESGLKWNLDNGFRVGPRISDANAELWSRSNCINLCVGPETGSQKTADYIDKDIKVPDIAQSARVTGKYGLPVKYNWMIGFPHETAADLALTLDAIDEVRRLNPASAHFVGLFNPYPGTRLLDEALKLGYRPPEDLVSWAKLREEQTLPFWDRPEELRAISFAAYFLFMLDVPGWTGSATKPLLRPLLWALKKISALRWKHRFFSFPLESMLIVKTRRLWEKLL